MKARRLAMAGLSLALGGCSLSQQMQAMRDAATSLRARLLEGQQAVGRAGERPAREAAQDVARPWLAGRAQPLAREVLLPRALRADVDTTLLFAGKATLPVLAERLHRATGIAVRVHPDALLPRAAFLPRLAGQAELAAEPPAQAELRAGPRPLADTLDALAAQLYVHWRYHRGAIEFYRTETRVFDVRTLALAASAQARLGRAGSGETGSFDHASSTVLSADAGKALQAVRDRVAAFLTRAGVIAEIEAGGSTLAVTDTPEALARIEKYLQGENRALTRRVRLVFEELTVRTTAAAEGGIDWQAVYASARAAASYAMPGGAGAAGALGARVLAGPWRDARALIAALSTMGAVLRHRSIPMLTLNRRAVTHAVRTTFSYVDQVQRLSPTAAAPGGRDAVPGLAVQQKRETVGTFLTLLPEARDDGRILLSISYDNTIAQPLRTLTFGEGGQQVSLQQIAIDGSGIVQQVELLPGQPVILSGFDHSEDQYERHRLFPDAPLAAGGHDRTARERVTTVVMVTAQIDEG